MSEQENKGYNTLDVTKKLGVAFDKIIEKTYGSHRAPEPLVTPTGIRHLDALLGGGVVSSGPVFITSTPESGKSTFAYQFSSVFQNSNENTIIVYLDIEGAGNLKDSTEYRISRIETFGLDTSRFKYEPVLLDVMEVFDLINNLVEIKKQFEQKTGKEFNVLVVWDSVPSTPASKTEEAADPNKVIGLKGRQLSFCLEKYNSVLKFNKITFIGIDQVRADIKIDGPYAASEKSVGTFKNMKTATNIYSLQHNVQQWMFLSRGKQIARDDAMGVDGWYLDIFTEKNKLTVSQHWVSCVFDKYSGIDKFWSEYTFLAQQTPSERKLYQNKNRKLPFPLQISTSGNKVVLDVKNPHDPNISYKSEPFFRKHAKEKYENDETFRQWFDYAMDMSIHYRITKGLFKDAKEGINALDNSDENPEEYDIPQGVGYDVEGEQYNPATGEVLE
ncbi:MAG: ATPase domain-containing protein [bacterium]